jgi:RNA polymerase sigma factor (sigma-70 family)
MVSPDRLDRRLSLMSTGTITNREPTKVSLIMRVCKLRDARSWSEFHAIYRPLIFGYLRGLGLKEHDADELTQEVFLQLLKFLPKFEFDRTRAQFRTYLWKVTYNTLIAGARWKKVRDRAEEEWVRRFSESDGSADWDLEVQWLREHQQRILEVALSRTRPMVPPKAWACFEGRLMRRRPAAEVAAELGITTNTVYVCTSRVLKDLRRLCAEIEGEQDDVGDLDLP